MEPPRLPPDARSPTTDRRGATLAGVAGYLAVLVGAIALLSAPLPVGTALVCVAAVTGLVRWAADRTPADPTETATRQAPAVESASD